MYQVLTQSMWLTAMTMLPLLRGANTTNDYTAVTKGLEVQKGSAKVWHNFDMNSKAPDHIPVSIMFAPPKLDLLLK